uniref:Myomaker, myoblast fusion factor n=1 Tax=Xiphophorus couchianus TaxID=32473 RepID=A0A3B5LUI1_9TELE
MGAFIAKMLLPTASSLVFLPAASVAAKRGFHTEAMVYFFTMFFTAIYHACDGPGLSILCFMRYDILEYFSVYGTALSMWVTLVALGDFDEPQRSTISMFGVLTIGVRIYQDRWGYGIYSGPIGSAVFIITIKWLQVGTFIKTIFLHIYCEFMRQIKCEKINLSCYCCLKKCTKNIQSESGGGF